MGLADYIKKREIGKGSFGVVFLTVCKHDRKRVRAEALERKKREKRASTRTHTHVHTLSLPLALSTPPLSFYLCVPVFPSTMSLRLKYVIKRIALQRATEKERRNAFQEAKLLSSLKHPNIVAHRESFISKDNSYLYIAMQYCEGGDLYTRLRQQAETGHLLPETQIMDWFVQIGLAIQYLHDKNIMHRDLKTQNVFLTKKQVVKVCSKGGGGETVSR